MYTGRKVRIATEKWSRDGNAFFIIGAVSRAMRDQGFTDAEVKTFQTEAAERDYKRLAELEALAQAVAAVNCATPGGWHAYACPVCKHEGATDDHYNECPVGKARALVAARQSVTA